MFPFRFQIQIAKIQGIFLQLFDSKPERKVNHTLGIGILVCVCLLS